MRPQLFTKENRQMREKDGKERDRKAECVSEGEERSRVKSVGTEIQLPISCRRQAAVLTMPVDSQLPLATTHSFCIVNKQFKEKCQPKTEVAAPAIISLPSSLLMQQPSCKASDRHGE